jgi:protein SCO1/2
MDFTAGEQFTILSISFDSREGPEMAAAAKRTALQRYGREGAAGGWHFLTGDERSIRKLTDAVGFRFEYDEQRGQFAHAAGLFVLTPGGKVARFFGGIQYSARDLRLGLVEATDNQIATATDQVLLLCYQYDPATGKYGFVIMNAIRLAGGLTVLAMALGIVVLLRRERTSTKTESSTAASRSDVQPTST